ncbi:DUF4817 domain-containing protein [Trichonephila clavipes]|uniref:DUF4817 domain-containing protein n=1 Tax=Trichonephila clavipes TaxID=2585209 RepID=A0A8X6RUP8_TRICX|nr:DUF4817 domain-containing protein [Trichonephila clavipes]
MKGANREMKALTKLVRHREKSLFAFFAETGSRIFSLTCPLGSLGPELMATLFQPNPRRAVVPTRRRNMSYSSCHNRFIERHVWCDRLISHFEPVNSPPRSCDLTPLDYFLWSYLKSLVYADKPQTLDHLEDNIRRVIANIRPQMLGKVIENWTSRLDYIRASRDSHMPEIIFEM